MKKNLKWLGALALTIMCAMSFTACGGDDDEPEGGNGGGQAQGITLENLAGTWQAIKAEGIKDWDERFATKTIIGLDSLEAPVRLFLYVNSTFKTQEPYWRSNRDENPRNHTWRQGNGIFPNGQGSVTLVGKSLQLTDSYREEYSLQFTIQQLTDKRLVLYYEDEGEKVTITYGRDGDGIVDADYYKVFKEDDDVNTPTGITLENLIGTWEITWSEGYTTKNGVKVDEWNESVADEHNRFVIDANRNVKFMEYSTSKGTWHEDGRGTLSNINGVWQCIGEINGKIVSVDGDKLVVEYHFEEDKGTDEYIGYYTDTCYRVR